MKTLKFYSICGISAVFGGFLGGFLGGFCGLFSNVEDTPKSLMRFHTFRSCAFYAVEGTLNENGLDIHPVPDFIKGMRLEHTEDTKSDQRSRQ